jgi:hypothetical protein
MIDGNHANPKYPATFGKQRQRAVAKRSNDLWVLQPQFNPKYHYPIPIFNNLALFEITNHAA